MRAEKWGGPGVGPRGAAAFRGWKEGPVKAAAGVKEEVSVVSWQPGEERGFRRRSHSRIRDGSLTVRAERG